MELRKKPSIKSLDFYPLLQKKESIQIICQKTMLKNNKMQLNTNTERIGYRDHMVMNRDTTKWEMMRVLFHTPQCVLKTFGGQEHIMSAEKDYGHQCILDME